jgi:hypothetical protein
MTRFPAVLSNHSLAEQIRRIFHPRAVCRQATPGNREETTACRHLAASSSSPVRSSSAA